MNHKNTFHFGYKKILVLFFITFILFGCTPPIEREIALVFYPPPPNPPRLQYLMGISDSTDIEGKPESFALLSVGGGKVTAIKNIGKGYGISAHNEKLYVCASAAGQVIILDFKNSKFDYLKGNITGPGKLVRPVNLTVDPEGNLYVADTSRNEIVVYNPSGDFVRSFGRNYENSNIVDVDYYDNQLYALDHKSNEIRIINPITGEQLHSIAGVDNEEGSVVLPIGMTIDDQGYIYVTNLGNGTITKFDRDGHLLLNFGRIGNSYGEFTRPRGIAVDSLGRIFAVDAGFGNVQIFDNDGKLLTFFGNPDPNLPAGTFNLPAGIAVTKDNLTYFQNLAAPSFKLEEIIFVLNQFGHPKISVFGLGEMDN